MWTLWLLIRNRYSIIEYLKESQNAPNPAPIAYFYCVRNGAEPQRADPDEIMRSILKQLSCTKLDAPVREPISRFYKEKIEESEAQGVEPEQLTLAETRKLILSLLEENPATIILDALDECNPSRRHELLNAPRRHHPEFVRVN